MPSSPLLTMGPSLFIPAVCVLMVFSGSMNTIGGKWADSIIVHKVHFTHPYFQTMCMFFGELCSLFVYLGIHYVRRARWRRQNIRGDGGDVLQFGADGEELEEPRLPDFNPLVFLPPALCDVVGTSLMYVGLTLTTASCFQMLRGSVIIFTGLLSVAFLDARLRGFKWCGMSLVTIGLIIVGLSTVFYDSKDPTADTNGMITGNLLIIMSQIMVAIQMVTEQKFVQQLDVPPLLAVGLEGLFGLLSMTVLLLPMYYIRVPATFSPSPSHRLEDIVFALKQMSESWQVVAALLCTVVSIAFFNVAGVTVTKYLSATTRMVLDSVRTLTIWAFSIPLFGERFIPLQLLGFTFLILGMFIYNDLLFGPWFRTRVLPRLNEDHPSVAVVCAAFFGIDLAMIHHERLFDDDDEEAFGEVGGLSGGRSGDQRQHQDPDERNNNNNNANTIFGGAVADGV